jgi:hypothetical protein
VLVCGGRHFKDRGFVFVTLSALHEANSIDVIIEGGATGADRLAREWAERQLIPVISYEADWRTHGKMAGPRRNAYMLVVGEPDLVVAFPGGTGTAHMIKIAKQRGVNVMLKGEHNYG